LLARYEAPLIECARRITGDADRARDAVQETFLKLCAQSRPPDESGVAAWLFTVCRNAALDIQRRDRGMNRVHESALPHDSGDGIDPAATTELAEEGSRALRELSRLPASQQEALRLRFQGGLSYREIARVTGTSIGNVGFLIHVGMKTLQSRMGALAPKGGRS
jgi:RNA polymerase sigma-70 factor (ECF subfamily)